MCCDKKEKVNERSTFLSVPRYIGSLLIYTFYKPMFIGAISYTFARDSINEGKGWGVL